MSSKRNFLEDGHSLVEIKLRNEFIKAASSMDDPAFADLKAVIAENDGQYMEGHEILQQMTGIMRDENIANDNDLSWYQRMQMKAVAWIFGKLGAIAENHREIVAEEVYASVPDDKKRQLCDALRTDPRVQNIVLEIK